MPLPQNPAPALGWNGPLGARLSSLRAALPERRAGSAPWVMLVQAVEVFAQTAASIVVARMLGASTFGQFAFAFAVSGALSVLLLFGTGDVAQSLYAETRHKPVLVLTATLRVWMRGAVICVLAAVAFCTATAVDASIALAVTFAMATLLANGIASAFNLAIVARGASRHDVRDVLATRSFLLVAVAAAGVAGSLSLVLSAYLIAAVSLAALRARHVHRRLFALRLERDAEIERLLSTRSRAVGVATIFGTISARADTLLLGMLAGPAATGLYAASYRFVNAFDAASSAIATSLYPRLLQALREPQRERATAPFVAVGALGALLVLMLAPLSGLLIKLFYGDAFAGAGDVLALLLASAASQVLIGFIHKAWIAHGHERVLARAQASAAAVNVMLNLWWIPVYGAIGAANAMLASQLVLLAFHFAAFHSLRRQRAEAVS